MLEQIFNSPSIQYLTRGMAAANLRQKVIADNIANVNTPNFKRSEVIFEDLLAREIYGDNEDKGKLPLARTHEKHIGPKDGKFYAVPTVNRRDDLTMRVDKNNVDIDEEMAHLAENQLYFQASARSLSTYLSGIKNVITSK